MVVAQFSVVPIGTGKTSVSKYVAQAQRLIEESGIKYRLTPMATVLEGDLDKIVAVVLKVHNEVFKMGALRVVTRLDIDDRRDSNLTMNGKIKSVEEKI